MRERKTRGSRMISMIIELYLTGDNHVDTLVEKFNISKKTFYRDIEPLKPMIVRSSKGTYNLSKPVSEELSAFNLKSKNNK